MMPGLKTKAPFGIASKRFSHIGYHPGLDPVGKESLDPGHYNPKEVSCIYQIRSLKDSWTRKTELEEFSHTLGYKNAALLISRQKARRQGGPGSYDIENSLFKQQSNNIIENVLFGTQRRFYNPQKQDQPGPGSYGKNHVPTTLIEEGRKPNLQFTKLPPFEWDGFVDRFKKQYRSWELPPNRYDIKEMGTMFEKVQQRLTKRGPYDCFTGPRDGSTIKGYFAPAAFKGAKIWPRLLPSEIDRLKAKSKEHYGKFFKADRFAKCAPSLSPDPAYYTLDKATPVKPSIHPFNSSVLYPRPTTRWILQPGAGRYKHKIQKCGMKVGRKETWQFKSKTQRTEYKAVEYNAF